MVCPEILNDIILTSNKNDKTIVFIYRLLLV
jgi:hypothetical protein